jgi:hypothetical protein
MQKRTVALLAVAALGAPATGVALATPPSGLTSEPLARGAAGEFRIHDRDLGLKLAARQSTDVAIVRATLEPGGFTGWHGHPGPSIVVVKSGTLTMVEAVGEHEHGHDDDDDDDHGEPGHGHDDDDHGEAGHCLVQEFASGSAFVHPRHAHNFENRGHEVAEFYVVYFVPAGATPLLEDVPTPPAECA